MCYSIVKSLVILYKEINSVCLRFNLHIIARARVELLFAGKAEQHPASMNQFIIIIL